MDIQSRIAKVVARLSGRGSASSVVGRLYSHAIGRPLLVHPQIGERLIAGFLQGADENGSAGAVADTAGTIAILNISGPLVHRPMPDICGPGPLSYVAIREAIDVALDDGNVAAIVLRLDSPGGMVSGCFDLVDYIFQQRGRKPIHAQADDMCYSGAYAIACACDSIQVTRTSGAGSVGVVTYHVDQSEFDAKEGIKITYIHSGSHKVDGNPHAPLPENVRIAWQKESDELREMFATIVARNRGMSLDAVLETEADCYMGQAAIDVGFADTIGTLGDLLARLSSPTAPAEPAQPTESLDMAETSPAVTVAASDPTPEQKAAAEKTAREAMAGRVSELIRKAELSSDVRMALLDTADGMTEANVVASITNAREIQDACAAAKMPEAAAGYVKRGADITTVRKQLTEAVASPADTELSNRAPSAAGSASSVWAKAVDAETKRATKGAK